MCTSTLRSRSWSDCAAESRSASVQQHPRSSSQQQNTTMLVQAYVCTAHAGSDSSCPSNFQGQGHSAQAAETGTDTMLSAHIRVD
jgi:hypothetical protein